MGVLLASHPLRHFKHFKHFSECAEGLHCISRIFLTPAEVEHILICLLAIWISFSVTVLFSSFVDLNISCIRKLLSTPTASPFDSLDTSFSIGPSVTMPLGPPTVSAQLEGRLGQSVWMLKLGNSATLFSQNGNISLHSDREYVRDPIEAHPLWPLVCSDFLFFPRVWSNIFLWSWLAFPDH